MIIAVGLDFKDDLRFALYSSVIKLKPGPLILDGVTHSTFKLLFSETAVMFAWGQTDQSF